MHQTEKYFSATSMDRENFAHFPYFKEQLALGRTCHYWQMNRDREGVHLLLRLPNFSKPDQKRRTKFKVYFPQTYFLYADASAAAAQNKEQYDTLERANNLIDVLGIKEKIVTSGRAYKIFVT